MAPLRVFLEGFFRFVEEYFYSLFSDSFEVFHRYFYITTLFNYFMLKQEVKVILFRYLIGVLLVVLSSFVRFIFQPLTFFVSSGVAALFTDVTLVGTNVVRINTNEFVFVPACAAVLAYVLLYLLILFTRGISWRLGWKLALLGSVIIFVVNVLRIELLFVVFFVLGKDYFQTLHLFIWKFVSGVFVALLWIFLVHKYKVKAIPVVSDILFLLSVRSRKK